MQSSVAPRPGRVNAKGISRRDARGVGADDLTFVRQFSASWRLMPFALTPSPARPADDAAWFGAGVFTIAEDLDAVDENMGDAG
jgi:hypothetical protein